jgi:hypothetical protein
MARVWFSRGDEARPWRISYVDGKQTRAEAVEFARAATLFQTEGFRELLPEGPRGIVEGDLYRVVGEVPA